MITEVKTKTGLDRAVLHAKTYYDDLPRKKQPLFRADLMEVAGYKTTTAFYDAINGRMLVKPEVAKAAEAFFRKYGVIQ